MIVKNPPPNQPIPAPAHQTHSSYPPQPPPAPAYGDMLLTFKSHLANNEPATARPPTNHKSRGAAKHAREQFGSSPSLSSSTLNSFPYSYVRPNLMQVSGEWGAQRRDGVALSFIRTFVLTRLASLASSPSTNTAPASSNTTSTTPPPPSSPK